MGIFFWILSKKEIEKLLPEIGIFHGVTARNVCELMFKNHGDNFNYIGIDIFDNSNAYDKEVVQKLLIIHLKPFISDI